MIGLFHAFTLALWLLGCAVLCEAQSSALEPKAAVCNPLCGDGLGCRVIDDKGQCVTLLNCAAVNCAAGFTCIESNGDPICVPQNKPGFCPERSSVRPCWPNKDNSTDQCFDDASCAGFQKCCPDVCRKECKTPITPCATVFCGFDATCVVINGEASCQPRVRPGICPNNLNGVTNCPTKPRPNSCELDAVCASGEKCCANGCGNLVCTKVQPVCTSSSCSSTSVCVEVTTTSQQTTNVSPKCSVPSSTSDYCTGRSNACKAKQTCLLTRRCFDEPTADCFPAVTCSDQINENPCNLIDCMPNQQCIVQQSLPPQALCVDIFTKPGQCPTLPPGTAGICIDGCQNDAACPENLKCCSNGCGRTCQAPANNPPPAPKPGQCPTLPPGTIGTCIEACQSDYNCTGNQKCCSNGCGVTCQEPVSNPPPTSKPGQCPALTPGTIGTCVKACTNDFNCTGDSKCCSNGCGHVCKAPAQTCNLLCPFGYHCQRVELSCPPYQRENCPISQPACVPDSIATSTTPVPTTAATTTFPEPTCAGVVCPYGQCCQLQTIFCIRAPCPPAFPSCVNCQSTSTSTPATPTPKPSTSSTSKPYQVPSGPSNHIVTIEDQALNDSYYSSGPTQSNTQSAYGSSNFVQPSLPNTQPASNNVQSSYGQQSSEGSGGHSGSSSSGSYSRGSNASKYPPKAGDCPEIDASVTCDTAANLCSGSDAECSGFEKCCPSNGCHICTAPVIYLK